ncbi:hypothetical protein H6G06_26910 [Anabaena sphaerica FACHB-251]|uniref:Chitin-binding type-2 domain-containing protein n=1 Tax=Anabaena sphaerica FACHB-251 TaxID=2692883 RepID=A0A927A281_9NOST|nr:hypothetical protein [Anabaena sphaerica FACHB-251]
MYANFDDVGVKSFYQCTAFGLQIMPCPSGLVFDFETQRCKWDINS